MNIMAVDDEPLALMELKSVIMEARPDSTIYCFNTPSEALEYAKKNRIDISFLDIEMGEMNGLQLAKSLKDIYGKTNIIFVTGYSRYALDAFALNASSYLMKPVAVKAVNEAIECLRHPVKPTNEKRLHVQTFGNFEVFADNKPVCFSRLKTKELFAYLINRNGALCSNNEIAGVIWEGKDDSSSLKSLFRNLVADLIKSLDAAGCRNIIIKQRGHIGVVVDKISCDLYDFYAGINVNRYMGEFMVQYNWAEFSNAYLENTQEKNPGIKNP
jgi:two-component SAPR family response regulator